MNEEKEKVTMSEAVRLFAKTVKLWQKTQPQLIYSEVLDALFTAVSPYVALWFSAQLLNEIAGERDRGRLISLAVLAAASAAALALLGGVIKHWYNARYSISYEMSRSVYLSKMHSMDYERMDDPKTYDAYSKIKQVDNYRGLGLRQPMKQLQTILKGAFKVIGAVVLCVSLFSQKVPEGSSLYFLNSPLALLGVISGLGALLLASFALSNRAESYILENTDTATFGNRMFGFIYTVNSERQRALDIRTYEQDKPMENIYSSVHIFDTLSPISRLSRGVKGAYTVMSELVLGLITGLIYLFVCLKAWAGAFGVGSVAQYITALTTCIAGVSEVLLSLADMRGNAPYLKMCFDFLALPNDMYQGSLTVEKRSDREYEIEFRNVSFKYPGSDVYALKNLNLRFKVGKRLAVVGLNGSGKTTMIKLLCRLYDPTEGEILLNGINIRKYDYDQYLGIFSVVFQDFQLLALPLGQNVAGSAEVDAERAERCLRDAGLNSALGLDTCLYKEFDKKGVEISGGEAQKIAIARALYKDAPFIILDEPTAALDPLSEAEVYESFDRLIEDRTAIYISHRLSSCKFCDEIAVFDGGAVIQQGTHEELVADEKGKYFELWHAQAQYYTA